MDGYEYYQAEHIQADWVAVDEATLLFVVKAGRVLLIRKKRGLGAGKINGPGGKRDVQETLQACAHREINEELCITIDRSQYRGRLRFQFIDGYSLDVSVFVATDYQGQPTETEEAVPLWYALDAIPFDEMWDDDRLWLPSVLSGSTVDGRFVFDGDKLLSYVLT
jgi:8-oxo-dGTP diphosphatase